MFAPTYPRCARRGERFVQAFLRGDVLAAQEDVTGGRLNRVRGNQHRFDQLMWRLLHQQPVLECAGLHFVGIAHHVFRAGVGTHRDQAPLHAGRKAGAAAPAQVGGPDERLHVGRCQRRHRCAKSFVAAFGSIPIEIERSARAVDQTRQRADVGRIGGAAQRHRYGSSSFATSAGSTGPCRSSSIIRHAPRSHAPRQQIGNSVKRPSRVVSP